jgi:hypothetical protein
MPLVWTGWKGAGSPVNKPKLIPGTVHGFREITGIDPGRLRLFFLSLIWRAAATTRPSFQRSVCRRTILSSCG